MLINGSGREKRVIVLFTKNAIGQYTYAYPAYVDHRDFKSRFGLCDEYCVLKGVNKYKPVPATNCFLSSGILRKVSKGRSICLKSTGFKFNWDCFAIVLDDEIEKHVYNLVEKKLGKKVEDYEFIKFLLGYGDKIGRSISNIEIRKEMSSGVLFADINSGFDDSLDNLNGNVVENAWEDPKPKEIAEAGAGQKIRFQPVVAPSSVKNGSTCAVSSKESPIQESSLNSSQNIDSNFTGKITIDEIVKIKEKIRKKIICQDRAIDDIVNNIFMNQACIATGNSDLIRNKANILLDGSTGTGKTFILEEVAMELKLPICITGATNYSTVGYKGDSLSDILYRLLEKTGGDLELAERGIVALDEFDKLGSYSDDNLSMRGGIQEELLTYINGTCVNVEYNGKTYNFDTSKLTFIAMGAFTKLRERKIRENEKKYKASIGFSSTDEEEIERKYTITSDDYIAEGLGRELVGRFTCLTYTRDLSIADLERILGDSESSPLLALKAACESLGCGVEIDTDIKQEIATMAFETNTGARGLIQIVQSLKDVILRKLLAEVSFDKKNIITAEDAQRKIIITKEDLNAINEVHVREYQARKGY